MLEFFKGPVVSGSANLHAHPIIGHADLTLGARVRDVLEAQIKVGGGRFHGIRYGVSWDASPAIGSGLPVDGTHAGQPCPAAAEVPPAEIVVLPAQVLVDTSKLYSWPKGQPSKFNDPGAFLTGV